MLKNIYLIGLSVVVSFTILYLIWKQKKQLEYLTELTRSIQPVQISNTIDKDFFIQETKQIHQKIEISYDRIHQQYIEIISTLDNMHSCLDNSLDENIHMENYDDSENIRSYHAENLIDIDRPINSLNFPMDEQPVIASLLGIGEISDTINNSEKTNDKTNEKSINNSEKTNDKTNKKSINSSTNEQKFSSNSDKISSNSNKINYEPIQENTNPLVKIEKDVISYSINSKTPKLQELRNMCKKYGLSSYGNKKELLERLSKVNVNF